MRDAISRPFHNVNVLDFNSRISCEMRFDSLNLTAQGYDISIHASHARCDWCQRAISSDHFISIHASHARCDLNRLHIDSISSDFNSRISCEMRSCTKPVPTTSAVFQFTHLMRDAIVTALAFSAFTLDFNSRISCEMRSFSRLNISGLTRFQFTHLMRDAIHFFDAIPVFITHFNSRISCEMRSWCCSIKYDADNFNSRISCEMRCTL